MEGTKSYITKEEFYKGKSIFITEGTSFLAKLLVEKLLHSCDVDKVYIRVRGKKGENVQKQVDDLTRVPAFDKIRATRPSDLEKIIALEGDTTEENYGMSEADLKLLYESVGVVIHLPVTNEPPRDSTQINLMETREIMRMCGRMRKLESLVYVSNDGMEAREVFYQPEDKINIPQTFFDEALEKIIPTLLRKLPKAYTLQSSLESDIVKMAKILPIAFVRLSLSEASQLLQQINQTLDLCILAAWHVAVNKQKSQTKMKITYPSLPIPQNFLKYKTQNFYSEAVTAYLINFSRRMRGKDPIMINFNKTPSVRKQYKFYSSVNSQKLIESMSKHDREVFSFDGCKVNLEKHIKDCMLGISKFILKEDQSTEASEMAKNRMMRLQMNQRLRRAVMVGVPSLIMAAILS